jgi:glycine/D-amino acid oxidase-like deaminating enzyme/nitrite reductase/ring-hydroxylating ferredoxin subunit
MTGRTTAHLTCALDDRWHHLASMRGKEDAAIAARAHAGAIDLIEAIQRDESIDCDFARLDGFLVPAHSKDVEELKKECEASKEVGLKDVVLEPGAPFSFYRNTPALRFPRQGRFHPLKYVNGLVACIQKKGGRLFSGHVVNTDGDGRPTVTLENKRQLRGKHLIVATNTPINDRVTIHTKQAPYRTYVVAGPVPKGSVPDALLWDTADPYHYVRLQPGAREDVLIVGGEDHKTGQAEDMDVRLSSLDQWARERFPDLGEIAWRWSGQVMESVDYLGYLGRNPGQENVYIISGDSGQGMTHTTIGAKIICDEIVGRKSEGEDLFDPGRVSVKSASTYAKENLNVVGQMADHLRPGDVESVDDIKAGSGAILRKGIHKIAAYRDPSGSVTQKSAICTHIGCVVAWNPLEKCWDCPCHGSQFAVDGSVINGPATKPLDDI